MARHVRSQIRPFVKHSIGYAGLLMLMLSAAILTSLFWNFDQQDRETTESARIDAEIQKENKVQILNEDLALERLAGDREMLAMLQEMILQEAPAMVQALKNTVSAQDAAALCSAAHSLKGSMAQLGAERVTDLCYRLEQMGADDKLGDSIPTLEVLLIEWTVLQEMLSSKVG